jgi:hypothetical protein
VNAPDKLDLKPTATFLPEDNGKINMVIGDDTDYDSCLHDKLNFALTFAHSVGDQEGYDRVVNVVESFTNLPLNVSTRKYDSAKGGYVTTPVTSVMEQQDKDAINEEVEDTFSRYTGDYGHGSAEDFVAEGRKVIASEASILAFIFTNHCAFFREAHYDG